MRVFIEKTDQLKRLDPILQIDYTKTETTVAIEPASAAAPDDDE
jgi:hypothetical protein